MHLDWFKMRTSWWYAIKNMSNNEAGQFLKSIYRFVCEDQEQYGTGREMFLCMEAIGVLKRDFDSMTTPSDSSSAGPEPDSDPADKKALI